MLSPSLLPPLEQVSPACHLPRPPPPPVPVPCARARLRAATGLGRFPSVQQLTSRVHRWKLTLPATTLRCKPLISPPASDFSSIHRRRCHCQLRQYSCSRALLPPRRLPSCSCAVASLRGRRWRSPWAPPWVPPRAPPRLAEHVHSPAEETGSRSSLLLVDPSAQQRAQQQRGGGLIPPPAPSRPARQAAKAVWP